MSITMFGRTLDRAGLSARVGDLSQVAHCRQVTIEDGQGRGRIAGPSPRWQCGVSRTPVGSQSTRTPAEDDP